MRTISYAVLASLALNLLGPANITARGDDEPVAGKESVPALTDAQAAEIVKIMKILDSETKVDVLNTPLDDLFNDISKEHKVKTTLDVPGLLRAGVPPNQQITINVKKLTVREFLQILLPPMKLTYKVRPDGLLITSDPPMETNQPKVLATARWQSKQLEARMSFIRNGEGAAAMFAPLDVEQSKDPAAQKEATERLATLFKVDAINWSKQMVLVLEAGRRSTGGYSVEVASLEVKDKSLVVKWKVNEPKPGSIVTQSLTYPAIAVLLDRFDGEIKFDPAEK